MDRELYRFSTNISNKGVRTMEIEKILELGKMGFTKDEILKMIGGGKSR